MTLVRERRSWRAMYVYRDDPHVRAHVRSTIGYRALCSCGFEGPTRTTVAATRTDGAEHARSHEFSEVHHGDESQR